MNNNPLTELVRICEDRILSMLIRDRNNPDYGFFGVRDIIIDNPAIQCLAYPLSLLITDKEFDSILYGEEISIRWTKASILNILKIQNKNGSFGSKNKFYWTPVLVYHTILAYRKMSVFFTETEKYTIEVSLIKAGNFLCKAKFKDYLRIIENCIALYELFRLTGDRKYDEHSSKLLLHLLKIQNSDGHFNSDKGFDIRKHFIISELLCRFHYLNKSDLSRSILKTSINLLLFLQRPDGSFENEIFEKEDFFTPPGFIIHMLKELPDTDLLVSGLVSSAERFGRKIIPYQDLLPFSISTGRLFSSFILLKNLNINKNLNSFHDNCTFIKDLSIVIINSKYFKAFINPLSSRIKIFSKEYYDDLVYADSGFMIRINDDHFNQHEDFNNHSLSLSQNHIKFSSALTPDKKGIIFNKNKNIEYERTISYSENNIIITSKFSLGDYDNSDIELFKLYRKINRTFRREDIDIPSRVNQHINLTYIDNRLTHKETLSFVNKKWEIEEYREIPVE